MSLKISVLALLTAVGVAVGADMTTTNAPVGPPTIKAHLLTPSDVVEIDVYRQPDLSTKARVDVNGMVTLPLLGSVKLGGLTAADARTVVRDLLAKDYLVNPQVTLTIAEYAKSPFTVMGEVQKPGSYEIPPEQSVNLLQAIAMAGGYTRLGAPGKVVVQRIERGQKRIYKLDTGSMASDEGVALFEILPGDMISVGEKIF